MVTVPFFDWFALGEADGLKFFGGVLDSTLGWSAPLPVESRKVSRKSPFEPIRGTYEEMPMAA